MFEDNDSKQGNDEKNRDSLNQRFGYPDSEMKFYRGLRLIEYHDSKFCFISPMFKPNPIQFYPRIRSKIDQIQLHSLNDAFHFIIKVNFSW